MREDIPCQPHDAAAAAAGVLQFDDKRQRGEDAVVRGAC